VPRVGGWTGAGLGVRGPFAGVLTFLLEWAVWFGWRGGGGVGVPFGFEGGRP